MTSDARDRMVASAVRLLAFRGLQGASFSEVLEDARAPRGSIYHHFPEGKDQLVGEAIELAGGRALTLLDALAGQPADVVVERFLALWRAVLTQSGFRAGCAVLAVTVESETPDLINRAEAIFRAWREKLAGLLEEGGLSAPAAVRWAAMLVAATEGAVVLARAEGGLAPFELVAAELVAGTRERMRAAKG